MRKLLTILIMLNYSCLYAQDTTETLDIDKQRENFLKKIQISSIPNPKEIEKSSKMIFEKELKDQKEGELITLAQAANKYVNLVGFIEEEYSSQKRSNYRYDFVIEKLDPPLAKYQEIKNKFLVIRNQAYFNLGMKSKNAGESIAALLYFRDAFRLSSFGCSEGTDNCIRWKAEQEMKELLQIDGVESYIYFK